MSKRLCVLSVIVSLANPSLAAGEREEFDRHETLLAKVEVDLRDLSGKLPTATADERVKLLAQLDEKTKERDRLVEQRPGVALKAYLATPKPDAKIADIMLNIIQQQIDADRYDEALKTATAMIDKKNAAPRVYELAGVAAFQSNRFDEAEKHLAAAKKAGALTGPGSNVARLLPTYKQLWAKEQELRAAEAKANNLPRVVFETTAGNITFEMFENEAPNSVANFIHLVEKGFYDGIVFHRVIPNFMAQGGDPTGRGSGGPGWAIACECHKENYRRHFRGTLSMAHAGRDTGGSQFFITFVPTSHLDGKHTAFGRVVEGDETLNKITRRDPGAPGEPTKILRATVQRKRGHDYLPEKLPSRR